MDGYIGRDLREKLANPIVFQRHPAAAESQVANKANGYDATILIDLCNAILAARRVFQRRSIHMLTDGLLYNPKGIDGKITVLA